METVRKCLTLEDIQVDDELSSEAPGDFRACRVLGLDSDSIVIQTSQQRIRRLQKSTFDILSFNRLTKESEELVPIFANVESLNTPDDLAYLEILDKMTEKGIPIPHFSGPFWKPKIEGDT